MQCWWQLYRTWNQQWWCIRLGELRSGHRSGCSVAVVSACMSAWCLDAALCLGMQQWMWWCGFRDVMWCWIRFGKVSGGGFAAVDSGTQWWVVDQCTATNIHILQEIVKCSTFGCWIRGYSTRLTGNKNEVVAGLRVPITGYVGSFEQGLWWWIQGWRMRLYDCMRGFGLVCCHLGDVRIYIWKLLAAVGLLLQRGGFWCGLLRRAVAVLRVLFIDLFFF